MVFFVLNISWSYRSTFSSADFNWSSLQLGVDTFNMRKKDFKLVIRSFSDSWIVVEHLCENASAHQYQKQKAQVDSSRWETSEKYVCCGRKFSKRFQNLEDISDLRPVDLSWEGDRWQNQKQKTIIFWNVRPTHWRLKATNISVP